MNKINLIDAETLYYKPLIHPKMLIEGILSDGLAVMAGDSKIGKSWMVLWFCLQISKGQPIWGFPVKKTDVVYLALEDREWRIQQRMQELTDMPPDNLHFGFSCGQIGAELESQIEEVLRDRPATGLIFIDTLQMVRDNVSSKVNTYAQDYRDLSSLKRIADNHGICIYLVHHTRKERDSGNIFNDITGSTAIMGVSDTVMILRRDERFGDNATLSITGRDVEERKLRMQMQGVRWEITEELNADDLRKERVPDFVFEIAEYVFKNKQFKGTISELLSAVGNTELKPNIASKYLTRYYGDFLAPIGISYEYRKTASARTIILELHDDGEGINISDGCDGNDGYSGSDRQPSSYEKQSIPFKEEGNPLPYITDDDYALLPYLSSQSSLPSSERANEDEKKMSEEEMGEKNTSGNIPEDFSEDLPEDLPFD
ncbi:MAG: AAA family ATPase [Clostridia bacterium]|nr:AAA family ATPase [Clostridia bacterium]